MAKWKRPDAANEMRCAKCGMRFRRAGLVPSHNVWGSHTKPMSTHCAGSGRAPRKAKGSRMSEIRIIRVESKPPGGWGRQDEVRRLLGD